MPAQDVALVKQWIQSGSLLHPFEQPRTIINVAKDACSYPDYSVALIILDGLGLELFNSVLGSSSFLQRHFKETVSSVFPATTAAALTSIATGLSPGEHGILGWTLYDGNILFNPLPWMNEETRSPLKDEVDPREVFKFPSMMGSCQAKVRTSLSAYSDSHFTRATCRGMNRMHCSSEDLGEALTKLGRIWKKNPAGSFTYIYCRQPDGLEHQHGPDSPEVAKLVHKVDRQLGDFWELSGNRKRKIFITADHGQILGEDIFPEIKSCVMSVEARSPAFFVKPGFSRDEAETELRDRLPGWAVLTADEVEELGLLGSTLSAQAREQLGDFFCLTISREIIGPSMQKGVHGGMTPMEMRVPFCFAED